MTVGVLGIVIGVLTTLIVAIFTPKIQHFLHVDIVEAVKSDPNRNAAELKSDQGVGGDRRKSQAISAWDHPAKRPVRSKNADTAVVSPPPKESATTDGTVVQEREVAPSLPRYGENLPQRPSVAQNVSAFFLIPHDQRIRVDFATLDRIADQAALDYCLTSILHAQWETIASTDISETLKLDGSKQNDVITPSWPQQYCRDNRVLL